ncbi:MAG: cysteine desulfurase, partial [Deltaproteobacteria bacterium]|nr:cysteine desulfurase [Deltaproteobacteria bacterium]
MIYLDHNATTPVDKDAVKIMKMYMTGEFGNPSSGYDLGARAKEAVERARQEVADLINCKSSELIFTSGGSESNNMVLKGITGLNSLEGKHILTSAIEHPAIINPAIYLMELGADVTFLPVDKYGMVTPGDIKKSINRKTVLISIMLANNETGTLQPVKEISKIAREYSIPFHTDAAQAVGKIEVDVKKLGVDFMSIAGHKLYGPKGVGALYIKEGMKLTPLIHGAGQEMGKRAGTENVILAAGLGASCRVAKERLEEDAGEIKKLRNLLQELLFDGINDLVLNGHPEERLPNTLNISIPGIDGGKLLGMLNNVVASTGAACHDRNVKLSHVLSAMGVKPEVGMGTLRLTLGRLNNRKQIEVAAGQIIEAAYRLR